MRNPWIFLCPAFLVGCDGYLAVKGQLVSAEPIGPLGDCQARIEDYPIYGENRLEIADNGSFQAGWVVAPRRQTYQVIISCSGFVDVQRTAVYGAVTEPGVPVDLGTIHVGRAANPESE